MRRKIRNPRFAPEFLERKLCPSAFGNLAVPVVVSTAGPAVVQTSATAPGASSAVAVGLSPAASTVSSVTIVVVGGDSTGPATDDSELDAVVTDPTDIDTTSVDVTPDAPADADTGADDDGDSDDPDPADDPGRPPFVPLPPAPIGPEAVAT